MFKSFREVLHFIGGIIAMMPFLLHFMEAIDLNKFVKDITEFYNISKDVVEDVESVEKVIYK